MDWCLSKQHCLQRLKSSPAHDFPVYTSQDHTVSQRDLLPAPILEPRPPRRLFSTDSSCLFSFPPPLWSCRYHGEVFHTALLNHFHTHCTPIAQLFQLAFRLVLAICTLQSNQNVSSRVKCICQGIRNTVRFTASTGMDRLRDSVMPIHLYNKHPFYKLH